VKHELGRAQTHASRLQSALSDGDEAKAGRELDSFGSATSAARTHTDSFGWKVLGHLPVVGDDARAARLVAQVGAEVADDALGPLVREAKGGLIGELTPKGGRVDLQAVRSLQPLAAKVTASLDDATRRLDGVDSASLFGFVRHPFDEALGKLDQARTAADSASRATRLVPAMLGANGPRDYLLLFDNNAEIRATGGIAGAYAILHADRGRLSLARQGSASEFGEFPRPVLPLTKAERSIYGPQPATYFQDTNMTPDFPRTAALAAAMYDRKHGQQVDGVMSVDAVTLGYLLHATGPVSVDGVTLNGDNAADQLLNKTYVRIRQPRLQDAFFADVARAVFDTVSSGSGSPTALAKALAKSVREGRMYLHATAPTEQKQLAGTEIAGALNYDPAARPQVGVYFADGTGAKMSYFLRAKTSVSSPSCAGSPQRLSGTVRLSEAVPGADDLTPYVTGAGRYGIPAGKQLVNVRLYGPSGAKFGTVTIDGKKIDTDVVVDQGRPVATVAVLVDDKAPVDVVWSVTLSAGAHTDVELATSPTMTAAAARRLINVGCDR